MNLTWQGHVDIRSSQKQKKRVKEGERERWVVIVANTAAVLGPALGMVCSTVSVSCWRNNSVYQFGSGAQCSATHGKYLFRCRNIIMTPTQ